MIIRASHVKAPMLLFFLWSLAPTTSVLYLRLPPQASTSGFHRIPLPLLSIGVLHVWLLPQPSDYNRSAVFRLSLQSSNSGYHRITSPPASTTVLQLQPRSSTTHFQLQPKYSSPKPLSTCTKIVLLKLPLTNPNSSSPTSITPPNSSPFNSSFKSLHH